MFGCAHADVASGESMIGVQHAYRTARVDALNRVAANLLFF